MSTGAGKWRPFVPTVLAGALVALGAVFYSPADSVPDQDAASEFARP